MNKIKEELQAIGLKEKEIEVYLALLALGKGTISDISRKSGIKRTSVYQHLNVFLEKNLASKTIIKKRIYYCAENPKKLVSLLEREKQAVENKKMRIEKIIPDLDILYIKSSNSPKIVFYEGKEGIRTVYEHMTDTWQNVYSIFSPQNFFNFFTFEENNAILMSLEKRGVKLYNLVEKSDKAKERLKIKKYNHFVKSKLLPDNLKFSTDVLVTDNRIALISFDSLTAIVIEDKAIANMQRNFIKYIWESLK